MPHVIEVDERTFGAQVVAESRRRPVVVDFWAAWCAPCRMLGPVLEKLAEEYGGRFLLAKLDTDQNQALAREFEITGIPAVKAFVDGRVEEEFTGALPEREVRRWLERFVPGPADELAEKGARALSEGMTAEAEQAFTRALELKPGHGPSLLALAQLAIDRGEAKEAGALLDRLSPDDRTRLAPQVASVRLKLRTASAGSLEEARANARERPGDLELQVELGRALGSAGRHEEALETLLGVVRQVRREGAGERARQAMLDVFEAAGSRSELSDEYRSRLAAELYR